MSKITMFKQYFLEQCSEQELQSIRQQTATDLGQRSMPGNIAYFVLFVSITGATDLGTQFPQLSWWCGFSILLMCMGRFVLSMQLRRQAFTQHLRLWHIG